MVHWVMRWVQSPSGCGADEVVQPAMRFSLHLLQVRVRQGTEVKIKAPRASPRAPPGAPLKVRQLSPPDHFHRFPGMLHPMKTNLLFAPCCRF